MDGTTRARIDTILAEFEGQETDIASAGRENTRTVNRVTRLAALKRAGDEKTFRRNVTRYSVAGTNDRLLIGAERAGGGTWRLIARWDTNASTAGQETAPDAAGPDA